MLLTQISNDEIIFCLRTVDSLRYLVLLCQLFKDVLVVRFRVLNFNPYILKQTSSAVVDRSNYFSHNILAAQHKNLK